MNEAKDNKAAVPDGECTLFDFELAAHLEGEERPKLAAHVQECPFCFSILADLEGICSASRELATEEPPARLWANIRASLVAEGIIRPPESSRRRRSWGWLTEAWLRNPVAIAALGCLLVLGIGLVKAPPFPRTASRAAPTDWSAFTKAAVALDPMETSYQSRAASFEPAVKETYQKSLDSLDREIRDCLKSVKQKPDDSLAQEYLLAAYEQKAHVLESALYLEGR